MKHLVISELLGPVRGEDLLEVQIDVVDNEEYLVEGLEGADT